MTDPSKPVRISSRSEAEATFREGRSGEVEVHLSKRSKERIDAKIRDLTHRNWGGSLRACIRRINAYTVGWIGFFVITLALAED